MTDREQVLSWLEWLTFDDWHMYHSDSEVQNIAKSAMELLKEQEAVVRCKDCKHQNWVNTETGCIVCKFGRGTNAPDWFCADGERKVSRE